VISRHALRNALGAATLVGLDLGILLGGAVVVEFIFVARPGPRILRRSSRSTSR
jgi:ABC-type dipeptide/oligopeptide/nickel transport system permease component